jgi:hypothetical protein
MGVFLAVVFSYACTEYQLVRLQAWDRVMSGHSLALLILLGANTISFLVMWASAAILIYASGGSAYGTATAVCLFAQALWLGQHLWTYHRNRPRLRYKN